MKRIVYSEECGIFEKKVNKAVSRIRRNYGIINVLRVMVGITFIVLLFILSN